MFIQLKNTEVNIYNSTSNKHCYHHEDY